MIYQPETSPIHSSAQKLDTITYEQTLNESLRLFLHLEHLFSGFNRYLESSSHYGLIEAIHYLTRILYTIDRPDLKTKLTHTLTQLTTTLAQLQSFPQIDTLKLNNLLLQLDKNIHFLLSQQGKIGDSLKYNEIICQIKSHSTHPSGPCREKIPLFDLWLNQPIETITNELKEWNSELRVIDNIISQILSITRNSSPLLSSQFKSGFYQHNFSENNTCDLIRLSIPCNIKCYPEFSIGKHRVAIRLMHVNEFHLRPIPSQQCLSASIAFCKV